MQLGSTILMEYEAKNKNKAQKQLIHNTNQRVLVLEFRANLQIFP